MTDTKTSSPDPYGGNYEWPSNIYREMRDMATVAFFIYEFSYFIDASRQAKKEGKPFTGVSVDDGDKIENSVGPFGRSFTPTEVTSLMRENATYLENYDGVEFSPKNLDTLYHILSQLQARADEFPNLERPLVVESFDDKYQKRECVYGIVRDSTNKRITVSFRGTDNKMALVSNWASNASIIKKKIEAPEMLKDFLKKDILYLHSGFYNYIFNETKDETDPEGTTKYDQILSELKPLVAKYPDYMVYVTGHSLGGALSGLFSFFLACEPDLPKPISCINFASPRFGGENYYKASQYLEKTKQLRMLRGVNDKDTVASIPSVGYYHGGVSITMEKNWLCCAASKPQLEYRKVQGSWFSKMRYDLSQSCLTSLNVGYDHGDYIDRINLHKDELEKHNLNELYMKQNFVGFDFTLV